MLSRLIKQLEADGLAFEGAEASFELLIRRHAPGYEAPFRIVDYTALVEQREGREQLAEATVKVAVDGEVLHTAADGNGPVNALDTALRKALSAFYPELESVHLVDYKVRILDGTAATAARTRVVITSIGGHARVVDHGLRDQHHRGVRDRPSPTPWSTPSGRPAPRSAAATSGASTRRAWCPGRPDTLEARVSRSGRPTAYGCVKRHSIGRGGPTATVADPGHVSWLIRRTPDPRVRRRA